jgi:virulence factor Mce-like protein
MRFRRRPAADTEPEPEAAATEELPEGWHARGNELARRHDWRGAAEAYAQAEREGDPRAAADAGVLHEYEGDLEAAEAAYRRADDGGDGLGALRLGLLLARRGDWDAAGEAYQRANARGHTAEDDFDLAALVREHTKARVFEGLDAGEPRRGPLTSPVLIGATTVLTLLLGVFLAYNANQGLPFLPTRELKVDVANGATLVAGNDVREGGFRIGLVSSIDPVQIGHGRVVAQLTLKLDKRYGSVPLDSSVTILSRSVLGLKYVDLHKGTSTQVFADGGTLPISQTRVPVQIDQVFDMFDPPTRTAIQNDLKGFGDTFTGRGSAVNDLISSLPPLLANLKPVAQYLSAPPTGLTRFLDTADTLVKTIVPVSPTLSRLFTDMATTFGAISSDRHALEATIAESPSTLSVATDSLRAQQPFLSDFTTLGHALAPATAELDAALPDINPAIEAGTRTLRRTPTLNAKLQGTMAALRSLALAPGTNVALNGLVSTVSTLNPMIRYLGPYQTVCDYFDYFWSELQDNVSEATSFGTAQRLMAKLGNPLQANNLGTPDAVAPANGGGSTGLLGGNEYLHNQNYGAAIERGGVADCETGQRGYPHMLNAADPKHRPIATDPHTPGDQGPTYAGRARVPNGETYSRAPTTGPQLPYNPANP